jgi:ribonuclease BN (tRNA processing enzyme)
VIARSCFDAGTSARRLVTEASLLDGVDHLEVALTHFHLDHVCGLGCLEALEVSARSGDPVNGSSVRRCAPPTFLPPTSSASSAPASRRWAAS